MKHEISDKIQIELNDQVSPGLIKGFDNADYINVVMPMRI